MRQKPVLWVLTALLLAPGLIEARITRIVIDRAESPTFDGASFGDVGPYEKIVGRAFGEVDPAHPLNAGIVNIDKALKNAAGRVEYTVDFYLLQPVDLRRGNGHIFYEVLNRGNKTVFFEFNETFPENDPTTEANAGNGFLMRQGYVILWSAWEGNVPAGDDRMLASFPVATDNGTPVVAMNRDEIVFNNTANPVEATLSYPAHTLDQTQATLTVRQREADPRVPIAVSEWSYVSSTRIRIMRPEGFDAGAIYEYIYPARDPIVMGLGFAATRDIVSFLRREATDDVGTPNPLGVHAAGSAIERVLAYGPSQSGRFLRDFLWQGFNEDEHGHKVFDGAIPHTAGSRKTFTNFEFAQPGRVQRQHEDHLYPGDQFPFTYATRFDAISGKTDGILARCLASDTCPKVMQTDSATEFWQGRASLVVTDETGHDIELPENTRVYLFSSTRHAPGASSGMCQQLLNPALYNPALRALLVALDDWVSGGIAPPASRYPNAADGTLVPSLPQADQGFPAIPGVTYSGLVNELAELDTSVQPPTPIPGHDYVVLVPKVDQDGNDIAGIRLPDIAVPLGTHTGWNLRRAGFAEGELCRNTESGSFIPFKTTRAERLTTGDPRLSLEERYRTHARYVREVERAARRLMRQGFLLEEDAERLIQEAKDRDIGLP